MKVNKSSYQIAQEITNELIEDYCMKCPIGLYHCSKNLLDCNDVKVDYRAKDLRMLKGYKYERITK